MIEGKRVLAVIPARSGSKGIPNKNIKLLDGKPLMAYTIDAALGSAYVDEVMVSTDSEEYGRIARSNGAAVPFLRSAKLAGDAARTIDALVEVRARYGEAGLAFDILLLLQPTSPFRTSADIDGALETFVEHDMQGVVSITPCDVSPLLIRTMEDGRLDRLLDSGSTVRRQDMRGYYYVNGAIYVNAMNDIRSETSLNDNPIGYVMPAERSLDIDEPADFAEAQAFMESRRGA